MMNVQIENIGNMAVVTCQGRIVRSDAAFKLRAAVVSQLSANVIVLDLSDVTAIEGGGLGMLWYLQRWASDHRIPLKLFNPANQVKERLDHLEPNPRFEIASHGEMMALLARADQHYAMAA